MVVCVQGSSIPDLFSMDRSIPQKIYEAVSHARSKESGIHFDLCGIPMHVMGDSSARALCVGFIRAYYSSGARRVGPYPERGIFISDDFLCRCEVEKDLARMPRLRLVNKKEWKHFVESAQDPCGFGQMIVAYAARWARIMQSRCFGVNIEQCALRTSFEIDFDGIRDIALPIAIIALRNSWVHGSSLLHASFQFTCFPRSR
jgi:hypothetical protein